MKKIMILIKTKFQMKMMLGSVMMKRVLDQV